MSKKRFFCGCLLSCLLFALVKPSFAYGSEDILQITRDAGYTVQEINKPKSSIIIDGSNGQILWEQEPDMPRDPASMSKIMTVFLVFDAIKAGKLSIDTKIKATENDQKISALYEISNNDIVAGVEYPVQELLKMVTVPSSNVATVMLANHISDNHAGAFIQRMNEKAKQLGMTGTTFYNCSGAAASSFQGYYTPENVDPNASNVTTARDLAIMTFELLKAHPEVLEFTNKPVVTVMQGTPYEETFETYNYSLPGAKYGLEGVDGLKTGSSPSGAFNYIATAKRGDTRLIEVILGVGDWSDQDGEYYRHPFGNALLEKAFKEYEYKKILSKGAHEIGGKTVYTGKDFYGVVKKDQEPQLALKDGKIQLAQPLTAVSGKIAPLALDYETSTTKKDGTKTGVFHSFFTQIKEKLFVYPISAIALASLGLLLFLISCVVPEKRRGRRNLRGGFASSVLKGLLLTGSVLSLLGALVCVVLEIL